ncbi:MAG: glycosyltransferase, partial [Hyphomicrobiales bacterium]
AKGLFVLEGWACGLPFVGFDHGALTELVAATGAGLLAPPGDAVALAEALAELLGNHERRTAMGRAGREAVLAGFTADHMAQGVLAVVEQLASGPTSPDLPRRAEKD